MVHTAKFYYSLSQEDISKMIDNNEGETLDSALANIDSQFKGIVSFITHPFGCTHLNVLVNFIDLLGKSEIVESDLSSIASILSAYTVKALSSSDYKILTLTKLEYRYDVVLPKQERELIFNLCRKTLNKSGHFKKHTDFSTTAYFQSKSITATIYDKEAERLDKKKTVHSYERDVLRYEVRLNSKHFSSMKSSKKWKLDKTLENYFKESMFLRYFQKYFSNFVFKSDFHSHESAIKIIRHSNLTDHWKTKLIDFLEYSNRFGLINAKKKYENRQYQTNIMKLEELNIDPLIASKIELRKKDYQVNPLTVFRS